MTAPGNQQMTVLLIQPAIKPIPERTTDLEIELQVELAAELKGDVVFPELELNKSDQN